MQSLSILDTTFNDLESMFMARFSGLSCWHRAPEISSAQEKLQDGKNVSCIYLMSCNALHDRGKYSQILIFHVILFVRMEPRKKPRKYKLHDLNKHLSI